MVPVRVGTSKGFGWDGIEASIKLLPYYCTAPIPRMYKELEEGNQVEFDDDDFDSVQVVPSFLPGNE